MSGARDQGIEIRAADSIGADSPRGRPVVPTFQTTTTGGIAQRLIVFGWRGKDDHRFLIWNSCWDGLILLSLLPLPWAFAVIGEMAGYR